MIVLSELKTELTTDPETLGYVGTDAEDSDILNEARASIQLNRSSIPMSEVYAQIDWDGEWLVLTDVKREAFRIITSTENIDVTSQNIRDAFSEIFGAGATLTALQGILTRDASRAEELWGEGAKVTTANCADARRL